MNSIYDAENLQPGFVPAVYGYYDRANMMESTPEVINHSHSLCEIMYVNEGTMSIETESNGFNQVSCNQFIWIDAGIRHWDLRFNKGLCSMMNIEYQYEEGNGAAPDLAGLLKPLLRPETLDECDYLLFNARDGAPLSKGLLDADWQLPEN